MVSVNSGLSRSSSRSERNDRFERIEAVGSGGETQPRFLSQLNKQEIAWPVAAVVRVAARWVAKSVGCAAGSATGRNKSGTPDRHPAGSVRFDLALQRFKPGLPFGGGFRLFCWGEQRTKLSPTKDLAG